MESMIYILISQKRKVWNKSPIIDLLSINFQYQKEQIILVLIIEPSQTFKISSFSLADHLYICLISYIITKMKGDKIFDNPFVAFDNSPLSITVLDVLDNMKHIIPKITILHVHKPQKIYLQEKNKGEAVFKYLKTRYPEDTNPHIFVQIKEMGEKNTNVIILENYVATSSSILFLGFVGSKGFKPRAQDLSSRIRQFVYESKFNLAIVKHADKQLGKVLFLLDGSQTSLEGLSNAIAFSKRFNKQLTVLHTFNEDLRKYSKHVKILLKGAQDAHKELKFQQIMQEKPLLDAVQERQANYDWIMMNKNGYRGSINKMRFIGSNTSAILENIDNNLIILN